MARLVHNLFVASCISMLAVSGCTRSNAVVVEGSSEAKPLETKEKIKAKLAEIASSGSGGSAFADIQAGLEEMKKTDPAFATPLLKEVEVAMNLQDPQAIKMAAGRLADKMK